MDPIKRARRFTWIMLLSSLVIMWVLIVLTIAIAIGEGRISWWRTAAALVAAILFTWLALRMLTSLLDRRYPTRLVVGTAVLALVVAVLGGGSPFSWGFTLMVWLTLAVLEVRRRTVVLIAVGTWVVSVGVSALYLVDGSSPVRPGSDAVSMMIIMVLVYGMWCAFLPPCNRMWMWIWSLAVQAHEGREAHTRLALAEERLRFARDLHDLVGHQLSAIAVKTELSVRLSDVNPAAAKAEMAEVNQLTRKALRELRQAVRGYRELDLAAELNSVKSVLEAAGVRCQVHLPYRELPDGVAPVFAYAVREAVTNVLKHSIATVCDITIRFTAEEAELRVRNDGVGRQQVAELGTGLAGLGERLAQVGGKVTALPTKDGQFILSAVVSLPIRG
ncbi:sensor histidine kinase [Nonomuraea jiangxiensis]|uniref:Two-component system, NarL family, sensor histidine kinase DesK n=1 Tax=Nonomuraea jiangxiensis TaxID=633440 RepID=A0A1G8V5I2_9ACTN|nr:histidine kinase [Nonomuraea jiangxiensis]SDJ61117.1 two-component system, NarL family, sensor histidine kinase DesK [Nonomuraea jiangxiensis]